METKQIGNLEVRIFPDLEQLSIQAAEIFVSASKERDVFTVSLSGGSTPKRLFELLGSDFKKDIPWSKIHVFWGDEREEKDNPQSSFQLAFQSWLKLVPANVHRIKIELGLIDGAREYAKIIEEWAPQGFDLSFNGAGADGHRNGVMPESPSSSWQNGIWDLPGTCKVWGYQLPSGINPYTKRITLTPWFLNKSKINILMLAGADKADLLRKIAINKKNYTKRKLPAITFNEVPTIVLADRKAVSRI